MKTTANNEYSPMGAVIDFVLSGLSRVRMSQRMAANGKRFSKDYRWGVTLAHRLIYRMVGSTVQMNITAEMIADPTL